MRTTRIIGLCVAVLLIAAGCELDGFLFNSEKTEAYTLPGNTIPDSLIEPVTFQSEGHTLYGFWIASSRGGQTRHR